MFVLTAQDVQAKRGWVLNGWKESCVYIWGWGVSEDWTQSSSRHRCHFPGSICEFVSVLGVDPTPAHFRWTYERRAALRTGKVVDRSEKDFLWVYCCEFPCCCLINYKVWLTAFLNRRVFVDKPHVRIRIYVWTCFFEQTWFTRYILAVLKSRNWDFKGKLESMLKRHDF